ncbi:tRNA (adenosine(37)-N6)-threonylcarbamoyltransferase complex ATPase subunit type 1 TsaE [Nevskia soli]|uniref:tRNA (adenosine(37)-N6)-threonylcarbamoyltransferase complex ATPase subunit type 1 TsaE n=1 Tax=Nevskia soli TaxID=418856 RepID=UPI00055B21DB|nr:tRNA (adenosine(37)-N6)-threonylcarbamoyltransferase complex ATPase subunit type 1 TsaE [Nevskia soli]
MSGTSVRLDLADAAATEAMGARLARALIGCAGLVVFLHGDLGAGKTTLVRGWLRELGASGAIRSPTYTLVEPYELAGRSLLHLDLYRLSDAAELEQLGVYDTPPESSVWLVEWPERGAGQLPTADLKIFLQAAGTGREIRLESTPALAPILAAAGLLPG